MNHKIIKKERTVAFVVARLSSSRLPRKQLRMIGGRPLISWIIDNLRRSRELDEMVIATVAEKENEPLRAFASKERIPCFWYEGEVDHVTNRLRQAAKAYESDICLLISGDCPLVYAPAIDHLILAMKDSPDADTIRIVPDRSGQPHVLEGVTIARRRAWQLADDLSDRPELKEHQFPVIKLRPDLFRTKECSLENDLYASPHRFSVDTMADLKFMNALHGALQNEGRPFDLKEVLYLLTKKPELREINAHVHQRGLKEITHKVLFLFDSNGDAERRRIVQDIDIATGIIERLSWPVTFLVDDKATSSQLEEVGFRTVCCTRGVFSRLDVSYSGGTEIQNLIARNDLIIVDSNRQTVPEWIQASGKAKSVWCVGSLNSCNKSLEQKNIHLPGEVLDALLPILMSIEKKCPRD